MKEKVRSSPEAELEKVESALKKAQDHLLGIQSDSVKGQHQRRCARGRVPGRDMQDVFPLDSLIYQGAC